MDINGTNFILPLERYYFILLNYIILLISPKRSFPLVCNIIIMVYHTMIMSDIWECTETIGSPASIMQKDNICNNCPKSLTK